MSSRARWEDEKRGGKGNIQYHETGEQVTRAGGGAELFVQYPEQVVIM
jgi:hypothetical protein